MHLSEIKIKKPLALTDEQKQKREVLLLDLTRLTPYKFTMRKSPIQDEFDAKRYEAQADEHQGEDKRIQVAYHGTPDVFIYLRGFSKDEQTKFFNQLGFIDHRRELKRNSRLEGWASIRVFP